MPGVTSGNVREELRGLAELSIKPPKTKPNLAITARWGRRQQGAIMPGPGRTEGLDVLDDMNDMNFGSGRVRVYLNETTFWADVPSSVWSYTLGGYQVLKKWLSYREQSILGRGLREEEAREFTQIARRIAAILFLHWKLDAHYRASADATTKS